MYLIAFYFIYVTCLLLGSVIGYLIGEWFYSFQPIFKLKQWLKNRREE